MKRKSLQRRLTCMLLCAAVLCFAACGRNSYHPTPGEDLPQTPFSVVPTSEADEADALSLVLPFNAVYRYFGGSETEDLRVYRFGNEPTYFEWMARKLAWTRDDAYLGELKEKIVSFPQTDNGYLWSWGTSVYWPTGNGELHYDGLFRYVSAVAEILRWTGDLSFLEAVDGTTYGDDKAVDASEGRTVYEKCAAALSYAKNLLRGETGVITLTEASAFLADGITRFDLNEDGKTVWNNTGKAGSSSSNYWDNLCFGNQDAYETALYYHALRDMADIERMRRNPAGAAACEETAKTVRAAFNETFWSEETGRYIACVDTDGRRRDPGLTFLNTEALCYGLGDAEKAEKIFSWIDGERIIPGDTLTGASVLSYTQVLNRALDRKEILQEYRFAPVTNTVSIEALSGDGVPWWFSLEGAINVGKDGNAAFGKHLENGGYIFYTVYYELSARAEYLGARSVARRAQELNDVYRYNGFDSDVGGWVEGLVGEFPENGLVSRVFLSSLAGVTAQADGLTVAPRLPASVKSFGVHALRYRGADAELEVEKNGLSLLSSSALSGTLRFYPANAGTYTVVLPDADGKEKEFPFAVASGEPLEIALTGSTAVTIKIS